MRICVAGAAGAFGMKHLDALSAIDGVEVTSVMGVEADNLEEFASARGIAHASKDLAECLARDDVDAVILATPTQVHASQAIQCLRAGKHVLVEKPLGVSVEECEELAATVHDSNLILQVGNNRRFDPGVAFARAFIQDEIGELMAITAW